MATVYKIVINRLGFPAQQFVILYFYNELFGCGIFFNVSSPSIFKFSFLTHSLFLFLHVFLQVATFLNKKKVGSD
jgi:hypothetical protein